jgi:hypothetical protein
MPQYTISVQGNIYKTITAEGGYNLATVNTIINADIANGIVRVDASRPLDIVITPIPNT